MKASIAAIQTNPGLGENESNRRRILERAAAVKADLLVFPECAITGYAFGTREAALAAAEPVTGPSVAALAAFARERGTHLVAGLLELREGMLFNTAVLVGPAGLQGVYRKMHLPYLGADRFATPGDTGFPVFDTPFGRIGILICFDLSFPEAARSLKLAGARILVVPTNWPEAAEVSCLLSPPVRAQENHAFVVTANRSGEEGGFTFRGQSRICDPQGRVLAAAGAGEETIQVEIDPSDADRNRVVIVPGEYELDRIESRRPVFYDRVSAARNPPSITGM